GDSAGMAGEPRIPSSFQDGTSKTIILAEKLSRCGMNGPSPATYTIGTLWSWSEGGAPAWVLMPGFAISTYASEPGWTAFNANFPGPTPKFQSLPSPWGTLITAASGNGCNPAITSTPHPAGMQVALGDGSVRTLGANISGVTWWAACTP